MLLLAAFRLQWKRSVFRNLTKEFGKAADCIACGQREEICPQHLPVIEHLKAVSAHFDK